MIIANIYGGLGNQLFQYAAAKALAIHHNVPLKLDTSFYSKGTHRHFDLNNLMIESEIASQDDVMSLTKGPIKNAYDKLRPNFKRRYFTEPHVHFYEPFFKSSPNTYLSGSWQCEKYFVSIREILFREFIFKPGLVDHLQWKASSMRNEESVSVHIRRGDYLLTNALCVLSKDYYKRALDLIATRVKDAKFYFFSDDVDWVKNNIQVSHPHEFVTGAVTKTHLEDFYLMQQCAHNIIANSTFSWWSAWLNQHPAKMVVAPKVWFNNPAVRVDDIVPEKWNKI